MAPGHPSLDLTAPWNFSAPAPTLWVDASLAMPGLAGFSRLIERVMNQRTTQSRYVEMGFGRRGGLWAGVVAALSGIVVIVLAVLFSALFLGLFVAIGVAVMVRAWLLGRGKPTRPDVIEADYTVVDQRDLPERRGRP